MKKKVVCYAGLAVVLCLLSAESKKNYKVAPVQPEPTVIQTAKPAAVVKLTEQPTTLPSEVVKPTEQPTTLPSESQDELKDEMYYDSLEELAICVEAEAGNQSLLGKRMVVDVILNRVDDPDWPNTIKEVIEQKYAFSSFWNGAMDRAEPSEETYKAVAMELKERSYPGLYYFTAEGYGKYGTPWKKVGDHYFCTK